MTELPELMPLDRIEPKRLNSNVMKGDRYENTKRDIAEHGIQEKLRLIPKDMYTGDPEQPHDRYVIEDGNQRYRIATELGIEAVPYEIVERPELESLAQNYRHQANRGEQDPLIEAQMFQLYLDQGLTQDQVVEELGLKNRDVLTHKIALLKLSEEAKEVLTDFPKVVEYRVRTRMYGEDEETVKALIEDIVQRCTITEGHYRAIATLPEEKDQMDIINAMLDTFIEGGTVSVRQVVDSVKQTKERNEYMKRFNKAWMNAIVKNCPECNGPPLSSTWNEAGQTFSCAHPDHGPWRYDKTPEEVAEEEEAERRRLKEERRLRDEEEAAKAKERDTNIIDRILQSHPDATQMDLIRWFYQAAPYQDFGEARAAVLQYLHDHPEVELKQPPTPEELEAKRLKEADGRKIYIAAKMESDTPTIERIIGLYRDTFTRKQLFDDYMELTRTISGQDGRDVIALYLQLHPEVTFPGDESVKLKEDADREIAAALGQSPMPEENKKRKVYYSIKVDEFEPEAYARKMLGKSFCYRYDTGQGGGGGPIKDREDMLALIQSAVKRIWETAREMKSYPRPTMKNTTVWVCQAAANEGLISEAEIWEALLTYPHTQETDQRPWGELCDGCTEDCEECPHDRESDEDAEEHEEAAEEPPRLELKITAAELHSRIVPWILGKVDELSDIKSIRIEGLRDKEEVLIEYTEPDKKGHTEFSFQVQTTTPTGENMRHVDSWEWLGFNTRQQASGLQVTSGKHAQTTPEDLENIAQFIDWAVYTDLDPWVGPNDIMGPTGFTLTPVDGKGEPVEEPTIPVPDHGRGYQEETPDLDSGEEYHEHYERDEDEPSEEEEPEETEISPQPTCPKCGKQSPNDNYCTHCGYFFGGEEAASEPEEDVAHGLSENEEKWLATGVKKLGPLAHGLTLEEARFLRETDTRKSAQVYLDKRIAELNLANAPVPELTKEADE